MSLNPSDVFVVLRWPAQPGRPRYSFATVVHARELREHAEEVQTCSTIEQAASLTARLNDEEKAA